MTTATTTTATAPTGPTGGNVLHVGDGMTLCYPSDRYPYVVVWRSASGKTVRVKPLRIVTLDTGHAPDRFEGSFPVWDHTYSEQERRDLIADDGAERTVRFTAASGWTSRGADFAAGGATYYRNFAN